MQIKLLVACREELESEVRAKLISAKGTIAPEFAGVASALRMAAFMQPDVLLFEVVEGEEQSAWDVLARIGNASGKTSVLLLADVLTTLTLIAAVRLGARGCLLKSSAPSLYTKAVTTVHRGEAWFGRTALAQALSSLSSQIATASVPRSSADKVLTTREGEALCLLRSGLRNKEIAQRMSISDETAKSHIHNIYVKLKKNGRGSVL